jgi:hypothetical protein
MDAFAHQVALTVKGQTNVALFGPRDTGKTTFTNQLALELAKEHGDDAPPFDVIKVNLQRVVSIPGFIGCVHDAMTAHPDKRLRRAAQRQIGALEKEIGFDIKVIKGTGLLPTPRVSLAASKDAAYCITRSSQNSVKCCISWPTRPQVKRRAGAARSRYGSGEPVDCPGIRAALTDWPSSARSSSLQRSTDTTTARMRLRWVSTSFSTSPSSSSVSIVPKSRIASRTVRSSSVRIRSVGGSAAKTRRKVDGTQDG